VNSLARYQLPFNEKDTVGEFKQRIRAEIGTSLTRAQMNLSVDRGDGAEPVPLASDAQTLAEANVKHRVTIQVMAEGDEDKFFCFAAGTSIAMANGASVAIEDVAIGHRVRTFDPVNNVPAESTVTSVFKFKPAKLVRIELAAADTGDVLPHHELVCTPDHAVSARGKGWSAVDPTAVPFIGSDDLANKLELVVGDVLEGLDGHDARVTAITHLDEMQCTHNFTVERTHCYYACVDSLLNYHLANCVAACSLYMISLHPLDNCFLIDN
jgi:hypothetical protein